MIKKGSTLSTSNTLVNSDINDVVDRQYDTIRRVWNSAHSNRKDGWRTQLFHGYTKDGRETETIIDYDYKLGDCGDDGPCVSLGPTTREETPDEKLHRENLKLQKKQLPKKTIPEHLDRNYDIWGKVIANNIEPTVFKRAQADKFYWKPNRKKTGSKY